MTLFIVDVNSDSDTNNIITTISCDSTKKITMLEPNRNYNVSIVYDTGPMVCIVNKIFMTSPDNNSDGTNSEFPIIISLFMNVLLL